MSDLPAVPERGPLTTYEVIWRSGHVERIAAHQVLWPSVVDSMFGPRRATTPRVLMHGEIDGQWKLLLAADEADILSVRAVPAEVDATEGGAR